MNHFTCGDPNGALVIYFHGAPGAPEEAAWWEAAALEHGLRVVGLNRSSIHPSLDGEAYFAAVAARVTTLASGGPVHFAGFSIGASVALRTAALIADQVASIHLISGAAPLEGGDFLPDMAGKPVFNLAKRSPKLLTWLSRFQCWLGRRSPRQLFRMLFSSAQGADRDLASDVVFQKAMHPILHKSLGPALQGYVRDIVSYVSPWADRITKIGPPVAVWHGDCDNWSPPAMARFFQTQCACHDDVHWIAGASHYSCLMAAIPGICKSLGTQTCALQA